ncbi:MAG: FAD-dependent oxidoreductase, partial [Acidimicrobiia bacterium]|nr:FAD-dependent oxidoreductase [Acidimicrobiia bacterium]
MTWRRSGHLTRLQDAAVDVAVVGGGIVGAGTALDLSARGASVALVERHDFAAGTSSKSTKLIHGGIRYMPQLRFGLVREGLREQRVLAETADYLYKPLDFVVPLYRGVSFGDLPKLLGHHRIVPTALRMGLFLYDRLGGRSQGHRRVGVATTRELAPGLITEGLRGAFVYQDAQTEDARLTIGVAKAAVARDAIALNHAEVVAVEPAHPGYRLNVRDNLGDTTLTFTARAVVAAAGSCVPTTPPGAPPLQLRYSRGTHLITERADVGLADSAVV